MARKPELLCPAGDMEKLQMAVLYGADAVYLAGTSFGMRSFTGNFTPEQLPQAIAFAHEHGVRVHVTVNTLPRAQELEALPEKKLSYREEHVASLRCDGIVSAVWRLSRSQGQTLFSQKKVFVNGRLTENGSQMLKDGDTVSVRGFGKFIFRGEKNTTKKGRLVIGADLFV